MGVAELVKSYYSAAQRNPALVNDLISAHDAALIGTLTKGGGNTLTQTQKNGISYTVLVNLSEMQRIQALRLAISHIQRGIAPTTRTQARF